MYFEKPSQAQCRFSLAIGSTCTVSSAWSDLCSTASEFRVQFSHNSTVEAPSANTFVRVREGQSPSVVSGLYCTRSPPGNKDGLVMGANAVVNLVAPSATVDRFPAGWDGSTEYKTVLRVTGGQWYVNCNSDSCDLKARICAWAIPLFLRGTCGAEYDDKKDHQHKKCRFWTCSSTYDRSHDVPAGCVLSQVTVSRGVHNADFGTATYKDVEIAGRLGGTLKFQLVFLRFLKQDLLRFKSLHFFN